MVLEPGQVASSIDWLTMTVMSRVKRDIINQMAEQEGQRLEEAGYARVDYTTHGYIGFRTGPLTYGRRTDDDIVRLSGYAAGERWRTWGRHADNVSRLDLQVTHRLAGEGRPIAQKLYADLVSGKTVLKVARGQSLVQASDGGATLYVGSRTSETYCRLYDKGVESGTAEPGEVWRWEVELKDKTALAMYTDLTRYTSSDIVIANHVRRIWTERGLPPPWLATADVTKPYVERSITDVARKLRWLTVQVAPTIAFLLKRGLRTDVLQALGVEECNLPTSKPP